MLIIKFSITENGSSIIWISKYLYLDRISWGKFFANHEYPIVLQYGFIFFTSSQILKSQSMFYSQSLCFQKIGEKVMKWKDF